MMQAVFLAALYSAGHDEYVQTPIHAAPVSSNDILDIIDNVKSSVSPEERKRYDELRSFESIL